MLFLKSHIQKQLYFFVIVLLLLITGIAVSAIFAKGDLFIEANFLHNQFLNTFFINYTFLGDGLFVMMLALVFLIANRYSLFVHIVASFLFSGILIQIVKRLLPAPRPQAFFESGVYTHFIDGVTHSGMNSFPSGHTTSAFALATVLALYTDNKIQTLVLLFLALVIGYSRIYLGQHFIHDVVAGAAIGVVSALATVYFIRDVTYEPQRSLVQLKLAL